MKCVFCQRPATKLCDAPVGRTRYVGHPPRYLMEKAKRSDVAFLRVSMEEIITCDRPMCGSCAVSLDEDIDYCPKCIEEIKIAAAKRRRWK